MISPVKVIDVELSSAIATIEGLQGYTSIWGLVRMHGTPIGMVQLPVINGRCPATVVRKAILENHGWALVRHLLRDLLSAPAPGGGWSPADLADAPHPLPNPNLPTVTVAVCTRDRTDSLVQCLDALGKLDYPCLDLVVVDNAPSNDATERLVRTSYPAVRYVREPRPGLDWARNRAIIEARGEIVAFTDDDVIVDPGWVRALAAVFAESPDAMAVTGLVVPYELETEAQVLFERYGGFGRGFEPRWYRLGTAGDRRWRYLGAGQFGTGANMAFRRCVFDRIGMFDPCLDVGTATNGGGDLDMFYRVLKEGYTLVYEPKAIVRHRHRREYAQLRTQISYNATGLISYWVRTALAYPDERPAILHIWLWWLWYWHIRRFLISCLHPVRFPRDLIWTELKSYLIGLVRYQKAKRAADPIQADDDSGPQAVPEKRASRPGSTQKLDAIAVRTVDLAHLLVGLPDVADHPVVEVIVTHNGSPLGSLKIANDFEQIGPSYLCQLIVDTFGLQLLDPNHFRDKTGLWAEAVMNVMHAYLPPGELPNEGEPAGLPLNIPVSAVVVTCDRPDDLRECLRCLTAQASARSIELVVVDNHPASGLTPPVVAEFPGVVLVNELRRGSSYARNTGFRASTGDIIVMCDDDVQMPADWLEKLVAPLAQSDVMVVTGNVLPLELDTAAQRLFEGYGGPGRGFEPRQVDDYWFESFRYRAVPTWELGGTANTAVRATILSDPQIGLLDEALGAGMPAGVGEDTYLFYRVLKAGHTIAYEPTAYVWHKNRRDMAALRRQIYACSKGHVSYHLTTLFRDRDLRSLFTLGVHLPLWRVRQIARVGKAYLQGRASEYPFALICLEVAGNLVGPWSYWRSRRRVKREGRSQPYLPVPLRSLHPEQGPTRQAGAEALLWAAGPGEGIDHW